jgi:excinuclease ABC subunit A
MRLLWARVGVPYSPATGLPIEAQTVSQMVDRVLAMPEGTRLLLLAPIARGKKGEFRKELAEFQRRGFERVKINGTLYQIAEAPKLDKKLKHDIEVVVDRIVVRDGIMQRLADSFETALGLADGIAYAENAYVGERTVFSSRFACPVSGFTIEEVEPRLFSFNSPHGACPACDGLGTESFFDAQLVVPQDDVALKDGAIAGKGADDVIATLVQYTNEKDPQLHRTTTPAACNPDGTVDIASLESDLTFFKEMKLIEDAGIKSTDVVDNSFAQKVVQELGPYRKP